MQNFTDLFSVDPDKRDEKWDRDFLSAFVQSPVRVLSPEAKQGPDGWPYLMVETDEKADDSVTDIIGWLSTRGIGLVVNPQKAFPDYVIPYGMVWNYRERGEFLTSAKPHKSGDLEIRDGQQVYTGSPSAAYLPTYARSIIKRFLLDQGVLAPRVVMLSVDQENYDLCFSLESLNSPPPHEHAGIAEALSWFLPAHYSIVLLSEKTVPGFELL